MFILKKFDSYTTWPLKLGVLNFPDVLKTPTKNFFLDFQKFSGTLGYELQQLKIMTSPIGISLGDKIFNLSSSYLTFLKHLENSTEIKTFTGGSRTFG